MVRGTGKFKGYRRGGGRNFSKHLNGDGTTVSTDDWMKRRRLRKMKRTKRKMEQEMNKEGQAFHNSNSVARRGAL
ncbi:hypothetical protein M404DRAFT_773832 [Pisolithus tinctorius Marx 270]|uniref:Uncharacterized protein n=1 Tax=Pisolithus tinctorius Marx 270 TaxID=870435 RepID=A0A0C3NY71_PISTI|nr:hypothetical protein M404DRAFT_773832 [Pisolithus tinctorius Marx 270]